MEELTNQNYFSVESNQQFMSASQFKDFMKCEVEALAKINGETQEEPSKAMLVGSYVDAYLSGEMEIFELRCTHKLLIRFNTKIVLIC